MFSYDLPAASKAHQRKLVIEALLSADAVTTSELRDLNIMMPAPRILELRRDGWPIRTTMVWSADQEGRMHRQARYSLERSSSCKAA